MQKRGEARYVEPGALAAFGACDSPAQLIEIVVAALGSSDPLTVWVRRGAATQLCSAYDSSVCDSVIWWPT